MNALNWLARLTLATAGITVLLLVNDKGALQQTGMLLSKAYAVIGRPLTPLSYAGVARRTTRRPVTAYAPAMVYAPGCYQLADAYGRVYWSCLTTTQAAPDEDERCGWACGGAE
jgi:hypothetical protein